MYKKKGKITTLFQRIFTLLLGNLQKNSMIPAAVKSFQDIVKTVPFTLTGRYKSLLNMLLGRSITKGEMPA